MADEGPGLDPEQAARVFDRFYQGSTARTGSGSGLGLSIVAALAAAHGGRASVRSTLGEGCAFVVELPRGIWGPGRRGAQGAQQAAGEPPGDGDGAARADGGGDRAGGPVRSRGAPAPNQPDDDHLVRPLPG